jgi:hypothetical protein
VIAHVISLSFELTYTSIWPFRTQAKRRRGQTLCWPLNTCLDRKKGKERRKKSRCGKNSMALFSKPVNHDVDAESSCSSEEERVEQEHEVKEESMEI